MPKYRVTAPNGKTYEVNAPDGATQEEVLAYAQQNYGGGGGETHQQKYERIRAELEAQSGQAPDPTEDMSAMDRFWAGAGKSVHDTGRGIQQLYAYAADAIAPRAPSMSDLVTGRDPSRSAEIQAKIDHDRQLDAPLMDTAAGNVGNVAGSVAQLVTPAIGLKGVGLASRVLLPTTIAGNAAQGAALGALQPTATGESRAGNAIIGGIAGGAGASLAKGLGAAYRGARNVMSNVGSVDRAAAERIAAEAEDAVGLRVREPSQTPGVERTLAEETRDPGIARLEQTMRGQPGFNWGARDTANNQAQTAVLERLAGTDADMAAAVSARDSMASGARQQAIQANPVEVQATLNALDDAIASNRGREALRGTLEGLRNRLASYLDDNGRIDVQTLDNVRMDIGDMLAGRMGGDSSAALKGSRELVGVRDALNQEAGQQVPAFEQYLNAYRQGSVPINRMEIGRELLDRGTRNVETDAAGNRVLAAKPLANAVRDLDSVAAKATGFGKAKADKILTSSDIAQLKALGDDFERRSFARSAGTGGNSASAARAGVLARMGNKAGNAVASLIPGGATLKSFAQFLDEKGQERIAERMAYLVANPAEFQKIYSALPPSGQKILLRAMTQLSGVAAAGFGATAAAQEQPMQVDVIGGQVGEFDPAELEALRARARMRAATSD